MVLSLVCLPAPNIEVGYKLLDNAFLKSLTSNSCCLPSPCYLSVLVSDFSLNVHLQLTGLDFFNSVWNNVLYMCLMLVARNSISTWLFEGKTQGNLKNHNKNSCRCRLTLKLGWQGSSEPLGAQNNCVHHLVVHKTKILSQTLADTLLFKITKLFDTSEVRINNILLE